MRALLLALLLPGATTAAVHAAPRTRLRGGSTSMMAAVAPALASLETAPIAGQKPGTSGVRKRTAVFRSERYVENLVQAFFDTLGEARLRGCTLVVGGDGRFFCVDAAQTILRMALANGVARCWVGVDGLIATPAVSALIREREGGVALAGIVLTASHNPGGPDADFGLKFNVENGGPAPESVTDAVYARTLELTRYRIATGTADVPLDRPGVHALSASGASMVVEVIDTTDEYAALAARCFDLPAIRALLARPDFSMAIDGMHGASGPYLRKVLADLLGCEPAALRNCKPLPDFGGGHPDPNLTYAPDLVRLLGLLRDGTPDPTADAASLPTFGAACDGDGDRNMILGAACFVTPSDSLALIAAHAMLLPQFASQGGLRAVARSMPTGAAVDRVAAALGIPCFETPSGWKFFGNLMDSHLLPRADGAQPPRYAPLLCGEESFGTGSDHVREKDGVWAILAWLQILAHYNADASKPLVGVSAIVGSHWATYGRNYYTRHDYEEVSADQGAELVRRLRELATGARPLPTAPLAPGAPALLSVTEFEYVDPVDGSVSRNQGLVAAFAGGARAVFRLSGTGSVGATIRLYVERYEPADVPAAPADARGVRAAPASLLVPTQVALRPVVEAALALSALRELTGRAEPDVIT